jgi:hypothetical protein
MDHEFRKRLAALMAEFEEQGLPGHDMAGDLLLIGVGEMLLHYTPESIDHRLKGIRVELSRRLQQEINEHDPRLN